MKSLRLALAAALGAGALIGAAPPIMSADPFTAPAWTSAVCRNIQFGAGGPILGLTPDMIAGVVGMPVEVAGTPAPQTLVVVEMGQSVNQSVVRTFLSNCGLPAPTWTDVLNPGDTLPAVDSEATLDLTVVAGILPANTTLKTATVNDGLDFYTALLNAARACGLDGITPSTWQRSQLDTPTGGCIISMSYAIFEKSLRQMLFLEGLTTTPQQDLYIAQTEQILAGLASAGVITVISSGDEGSGGCQPLTRGLQNEMAPQWPSTSANVLSVGGTMWAPVGWNGAAITTASSYVPGVPLIPVAWRNWNLGSDCLWQTTPSSVTWPGIGTTGGESQFVTRPDFQSNVAGSLPGSTGRLSPDISGLAGWPTWLVPFNNDGNQVTYAMGTSAAAPLLAVGFAHVNAALTARGLTPIHNGGGPLDIHNVLYNPAFASALNDVTLGTNNLWSSDLWTGPTAVTTTVDLQRIGFLDGSLNQTANVFNGFTSTAGYDLTTGLGVPNFSTLTRLLINAQTVAFDPLGPPPILQQVPLPAAGTCSAVIDGPFAWAGVGSGRWGQSWAQWANSGQGGPVCTRTLIYNSALGAWMIHS